jgi:hypothetical protein
MRSVVRPQCGLFSDVSPGQRTPPDHPQRRVRVSTEQALAAISSEPDGKYGSSGRVSIAPKRLLRRQPLTALYSVRWGLAFCEQLDTSSCVDFKGERRTSAMPASTSDPEPRLMRRGVGQPAKLSCGGNALMDNRAGLCADLHTTDPRLGEPQVAEQLLARQRRDRV